MLLQAVAAVIVATPTIEKSWYREADVWVALGTLLLAGVTTWLARETRKLRMDGAEAIKAAKQSARAAELSAGIAQESMLRSLRPYLLVHRFTTDVFEKHSLPKRFQLWITNVGQTPSIETQYNLHCGIVKTFSKPHKPVETLVIDLSLMTIGFLGPSHEHNVVVDFDEKVMDNLLSEFMDTKCMIVITGSITYHDPLYNKQQTTGFEYRWQHPEDNFHIISSTMT